MPTIAFAAPNQTVTVTKAGAYDIDIEAGATGSVLVFSGSGTSIITGVTGVAKDYTIEATDGSSIFIDSLAKGASAVALRIGAGSHVTLDSDISEKSVIKASFSGAGGTLSIVPALPKMLKTPPVISGFGPGDHIELYGNDASDYTTSYDPSTHLLVFEHRGHAAGVVQIVGDYTPANFVVATEINYAACFLRGTRISTLRGEVAVEALAIGDQVKVANGKPMPVKWIARRSYNRAFARRNANVLPVCIRAGALADGVPLRDLYVTPHHAMAIDGLLIHAIELVNGLSVLQETVPSLVEYFHVELDRHALVFAEGAPTESYVNCANRHLFHNAYEYATLYGEDATTTTAAFCMPVVNGGPLADAARARIAARAGLACPALATEGRLLGFVDYVGADVAEGWAMDEADRDSPVVLDILEDGHLVTRIVADRFRPDLIRERVGTGRQGFRVALPARAGQRHIVVRRSLDGEVLAGSHGCKKRFAA